MEIKHFFKKTYMFADSKIQDCSRCLADSKELPEQTKTTTTTDYLRLFRIFFPFQNFPHNIMTFVTLLSPSSTSSPPLLHPPKIFPFLFHFYFHFYGIFDVHRGRIFHSKSLNPSSAPSAAAASLLQPL